MGVSGGLQRPTEGLFDLFARHDAELLQRLEFLHGGSQDRDDRRGELDGMVGEDVGRQLGGGDGAQPGDRFADQIDFFHTLGG